MNTLNALYYLVGFSSTFQFINSNNLLTYQYDKEQSKLTIKNKSICPSIVISIPKKLNKERLSLSSQNENIYINSDIKKTLIPARTSVLLDTKIFPYDQAKNFIKWGKEGNTDKLENMDLPVKGKFKIANGFQEGTHQYGIQNHYAVDILLPRNTPIYSISDGQVVEVVSNFGEGKPIVRYLNKSNTIRVCDPKTGKTFSYVHLAKNSNTVSVGDIIKTGDLIALSGNSGFSTEPHIHFSISYIDDETLEYRSIPFLLNNKTPKSGIIVGQNLTLWDKIKEKIGL